MADRIIVIGKSPARIRADFRVCMPQPRQQNSPEFLLYVDYIYKLMTQPKLEAEPPVLGRESAPSHRAIPHAREGSIAGMIELLHDAGGKEDLYRIAEDLRMEVDDLLPIIEAAALLQFAKSESGDVELTANGSEFAEADISERRALFRKALLANVPLIQQMSSCLTSKADHSMPLEFFRDIVEKHFSDEDARHQIETALNWGRYGDIFTYDSESDRLLLNQPAASLSRSEAPQRL